MQQDGVETLHQHQATLKQETGLSSLPWYPSNPPAKDSVGIGLKELGAWVGDHVCCAHEILLHVNLHVIYYFNCISFAIRLSGRKVAIKLNDWLIDW